MLHRSPQKMVGLADPRMSDLFQKGGSLAIANSSPRSSVQLYQ